MPAAIFSSLVDGANSQFRREHRFRYRVSPETAGIAVRRDLLGKTSVPADPARFVVAALFSPG
jgi:hypothetical protein